MNGACRTGCSGRRDSRMPIKLMGIPNRRYECCLCLTTVEVVTFRGSPSWRAADPLSVTALSPVSRVFPEAVQELAAGGDCFTAQGPSPPTKRPIARPQLCAGGATTPVTRRAARSPPMLPEYGCVSLSSSSSSPGAPGVISGLVSADLSRWHGMRLLVGSDDEGAPPGHAEDDALVAEKL